ncbi:PREDICTED: modulator of retrovirus infection homolog [Gavialis gangeticus]|uniref:modulator of retrovirus infection homolog n=1 Tax=Gavialis gangeticus TaxID=94835 RepID=UPI00092E4931|nr:PREDICTED: modulator of retrovirus infection homolog [Gavialis gangeticus]
MVLTIRTGSPYFDLCACVLIVMCKRKRCPQEMEASASTAKKRVLPSWMIAGVAEQRETMPPARPKRRKKAAEAGTVTVYCMNEAELVTVALGILAENLKCKEREDKVLSENEEEQGCQQLQIDPQWSPATTSGSRTPKSGTKPQTEALGCADRTVSEDEDDDVLKYVREIFFT